MNVLFGEGRCFCFFFIVLGVAILMFIIIDSGFPICFSVLIFVNIGFTFIIPIGIINRLVVSVTNTT